MKSERANIESAALIVPLLVLFLIGAQLAISVHFRNIERAIAQDAATTRAISGEFDSGDEFMHIDSGGGQGLDLLVTNREREIPQLVPKYFNLDPIRTTIDINGLAVIENQR